MQQINLFLAEFIPTPQRYSLQTLLRLLLGLLVLLLIVGAFLFQQVQRERQRSTDARTKLDAIISTISQTHGNEQARQNVAERLQKLRKQLIEQQALLTELQQREEKQTAGFAPLLQALAQEHDSRLWLTHIALKDNQLQLAGETLNAAAVPNWLGRLQSRPPIQGLRFAGMQLSRVEAKPGVLAFSLNPNVIANGEQANATVQR